MESRTTRTDPILLDAAMAVGLTAFGWLQLNLTRVLFALGLTAPRPFREGFGFGFHGQVPPGPMTYVLLGACFLPLVLRRRFPLEVLALVTVSEAAFELLPHPPAFTVLGPLVALYTVGTMFERRTVTLAAVGTGLLLLLTSLPGFGDSRWLAEFARIIAMVAFAAALGNGARTQRAYIAEAERRAEEAELRAEEEAARRVDEERLRIARELHDVTAHSLSVIAVQSGAAAHVLDADPAAARRALEDIRATSRKSLQELRSVVGSLRAAGDRDVPLAPTPGLARLSELVRPVEEAGVVVTMHVEGDISDLPQLVDASAYRIVQEALTNVIRHSGAGTHAMLRVERREGVLDIEITDEGRGGDMNTGGHGIAGMRERAFALGGSFEAGPRPEGGWRVYATLPLREEEQA